VRYIDKDKLIRHPSTASGFNDVLQRDTIRLKVPVFLQIALAIEAHLAKQRTST
jgi:hypothetical protein